MPLFLGALFFGLILLGSGPNRFTGDEGAQLAATAYLHDRGSLLAYPYGGAITNTFPVLGSLRLLITALAATKLGIYSSNLMALGTITVLSYYTAYSALRLPTVIPRWCAHIGSFLFTFGLHAIERVPNHLNVWSPYSTALTFAALWIIGLKKVIPAYQLVIMGVGIGSGSHYYALGSLMLIPIISLASFIADKNDNWSYHLIARAKQAAYICFGIGAGLLPSIATYKHYLSKIPDFVALPRGITDQYNYGLSIYRLFIPPSNTPLLPDSFALSLESGDITKGIEQWDVFLGYFGLIGLLYLIFLSLRGIRWASIALAISILSALFSTKGGFGHLIHVGLTDAIRAQARYSQYVYFASISGYCAGLKEIARIGASKAKRLSYSSAILKIFLIANSFFFYIISLPKSSLHKHITNSILRLYDLVLAQPPPPRKVNAYNLGKINNIKNGSRILFIPTFQHPGTAEAIRGIDISYSQTDATLNANPSFYKTTAALPDLMLIRDLGASSAILNNHIGTTPINQNDLLVRWCSLEFDAIVDYPKMPRDSVSLDNLLSELPTFKVDDGLLVRKLGNRCAALTKSTPAAYSISPTRGFSPVEKTIPNGSRNTVRWQWATSSRAYIRVYTLDNINRIKLVIANPGPKQFFYSVNGGKYKELAMSSPIKSYALYGSFKKGINTIELTTKSKPIKGANSDIQQLYYQVFL